MNHDDQHKLIDNNQEATMTEHDQYDQIPKGTTTGLPTELDISTLDLGGWQHNEMFNFRDWLEAALVAKGAKVIGKGAGCGGCDLGIEVDGLRFSITAKPSLR